MKLELCDAISPLLGERGRWLAAQNPEWSWATGASGEDDDIWETGDLPTRLACLRKLRETQPGHARELLASTWKVDPAEDRAAFIAVFETGLSQDDEAFLEAAVDDKRKEVRRNAAALLARIPDSGLVKRMTRRVLPLLRFASAETGSVLKLKKSKPAVLEVSLPAECDKPMQRDGVDLKPPAGMGEKGWWLAQMLGAVPLSTWTDAWQCGMDEILGASEHSEWKTELFEGWTLAAIGQRNADWAVALLPIALEPGRSARLESLLAIVPLQYAETHLLKYLSGNFRKFVDSPAILPWLCQHEWSANFSIAVLDFLRALTASESSDWQFRNRLVNFASCLAPESFSQALNGWPTDSAGWPFWAKGMEDFLAVVQFRSDIHSAFQQQSSQSHEQPTPTTR